MKDQKLFTTLHDLFSVFALESDMDEIKRAIIQDDKEKSQKEPLNISKDNNMKTESRNKIVNNAIDFIMKSVSSPIYFRRRSSIIEELKLLKSQNINKENYDNDFTFHVLKNAMEIIDDYLNAGTKEERTKAHKKAKELYKFFHGKNFVNRSEREIDRIEWKLHLNENPNYVLKNKTGRDYTITSNYNEGMSFKTEEMASKYAEVHRLRFFKPVDKQIIGAY